MTCVGFRGWTAPLWGQWYASNGQRGEEPPEDVRELQLLYDELKSNADPAEQERIGKELVRQIVENQFSIAYVASRAVIAMDADLRNVAGEEAVMDWRLKSPNYMQPEQWYYAR